jgi:hypothetical protein
MNYSELKFEPPSLIPPFLDRDEKWHHDAFLRLGYRKNVDDLPLFKFYTIAPNVAGLGTLNESYSIMLNGKRVGKLYFHIMTGNTITEMFSEPEEVLPGEIWLLPVESDNDFQSLTP